jgi:type I restriction enzyme, R subunit
MTSSERQIEEQLLQRLRDLKYDHRADIRDRAALENNFRERFQALNKVELTDGEFQRLRDEIITPDVFSAAKILRGINSFTPDDGTPLNYTLVNIKDWCKNSFEIVSQLRINTDYSHHRYDVLLLINGVPAVQIELKTLGINPRRAMEQIVEYKNDPGNGYSRTLLCFVQLFVVSSRDNHAAKPRTVDPIAQLPLRNLAGPTLPGSPNRIGRWISHLPDDDWWL